MTVVSSFSAVDYGILGVLGASGLLGFFRGLTREVVGLLVWGGALWATTWLEPFVRPLLAPHLQHHHPAILSTCSLGGSFLALLLAGSFLSKISSALIRGSALSSIDRTLGLPFGLARGYLIGACALFACCALTGGTLPAVVEEAQLFPFLRPGAAWICSLVEPILGKDGVSLSGLMESSSSVRERVEDFVAPRVRKQEHQEENIDSLVQHS